MSGDGPILGSSEDAARSADVKLLDMEFDTEEDIASELEDFILLSRLRLFYAADQSFERNLLPHIIFFPVVAEYAEMLFASHRYERVAGFLCVALEAVPYSEEEKDLLGLMKALAEAKVEQQKAYQRSPSVSADIDHPKLDAAFRLAKDWHQKQIFGGDEEVQNHCLEIYLSILTLAHIYKSSPIADALYQPPGRAVHHHRPWSGFIVWTARLNEEGRYWEAHKVFAALQIVVPSVEINKLFADYMRSSGASPGDIPSKLIAQAAATEEYLGLMSTDRRYQDLVPNNQELIEDLLKRLKTAEHPRLRHFVTEIQKELKLIKSRSQPPKPDAMRTPQNRTLEDIEISNTRPKQKDTRGGEVGDKSLSRDKNSYDDSVWPPDQRFDRLPSNPSGPAMDLLLAAREGDVEKVRSRLAAGVDVNIQSGLSNKLEGLTALALAAERGHSDVVSLLLQNGNINVNAASEEGQTPLVMAAKYGHVNVVKQLLDRKDISVTMQDENLNSALTLSARNGHVAVVAALLKRGDVNPNTMDSEGRTPVSLAAAAGHLQVVKALLETPVVNPDISDRDDHTALSLAAQMDHLAVIEILLQWPNIDTNREFVLNSKRLMRLPGGPSISSTLDRSALRGSVLHWACLLGELGIVRALLRRDDVDVNLKGVKGINGLLAAAEGGYLAITRMLIADNRTQYSLTDADGWTALHGAASSGHHAIVDLLLSTHLTSLGVRTNHGETPLTLAAKGGHRMAVKVLLDAGADVNAQDVNSRTPLIHAANQGHITVVRDLLDRGAEIRATDLFNKRVINIAIQHGHLTMVRLLLSRDPRLVDESEVNVHHPLLEAIKYRRTAISTLLVEHMESGRLGAVMRFAVEMGVRFAPAEEDNPDDEGEEE